MPGVFAYTEATNLIWVTGGTALAPAEFIDFVIADRANRAFLLAVAGCGIGMTLTYQVRPVENLAITCYFTLAGTTAGAGDTLDVTGTDWDGNAQIENINVAAGNGEYTGSNKWRTITNIDCTGWNDGTLKVEQGRWGVIWDYGGGQFRIDCIFYIGDNVNPTYFASEQEQIYFSDGNRISIRANAEGRFGELYGDWGNNGSSISISPPAGLELNRGTFKFYASQLHSRTNAQIRIFNIGDIRNSILNGVYYDGGAPGDNQIEIQSANVALRNVFLCNWDILYVATAPTIFENVHIHRSRIGVGSAGTNLSIMRPHFTSIGEYDAFSWGTDEIEIIDPTTGLVNLFILTVGDWIRERYTCNIHIVDRDGIPIQNATVACEDQFGTPVFSVNTDVNGNIVEQIITYRQWIDPTETLTTYSPHVFTISRAGYETLELDDITVDAPIVWHLELLPLLAEVDVRLGTGYGEDKIGVLDLPSINDVEDGVFFDSLTQEGNFEAPAEEDVEVGVGYGSLGTEFTGNYLGLAGTNLTGTLEDETNMVATLEEETNMIGYLEKVC